MDKSEKVLAEGMNRVRGRLLGLVESFGLPEKHERAIKATLKAVSYDLQENLARELRELKK